MANKKDMDNVGSESALRNAAKDQLGKSPDHETVELKDDTPEEIIHELQVHQIELELQNEELKSLQLELEASRVKYLDLYDFAPVGYFTLTRKGLVKDVNLTGATLLGMPRPKLLGRGFGHFVAPESLDLWDKHINVLPKQEEKAACDLTLKRDDGSIFYAHLESIRIDAPVQLQSQNAKSYLIRMAVTDVTELKRMEESLRESERNRAEEALRKGEEKYRLLAENTRDVIWQVDLNLVFTYVNPAIVQMAGYTQEEWIGSRLSEHCDEENFTKMAQVVSAAISKGPGSSDITIEAMMLKKNKEPFPVEIVGKVLFDENRNPVCLQGVTRDISQRKRAEEALTESEQRYRSLFEGSRDGIVLIDMEGRFKEFNAKYLEMLGYSAEELLVKTYKDITPARWETDEDRIVAEQIISRGYSDIYEKEYICKDGIILYIELTVFLIKKDGENVGMWAIVRDISERKRLEMERLEMERKLLHAQKLESLSVMAGGIAHDFNNLLMAALGNLEFALTDPNVAPKTRRSIENAIQASERSAELSRQMLIYSGSAHYAPKNLDLNELAHKHLDLLNSVIPKTTTLHLKIDKGHIAIRGDADQIQQIITNLAINASEAIGAADGDVTIRTGVMDCDAAYLGRSQLKDKPEPGRFGFLDITDTGCGMDADTLHKLFDPFFTTKFWGRGLGMAEVIGIVKGHHGAIIVESEVGKGSNIRVLFPVPTKVQPLSVTDVKIAETKSPAPVSATKRKTVLVVDDEELVRSMILMRLEVLGYDTIAAVDGAEGVHLFRERLNEIDLVLLDFAMPKMNGVEAFGALIRIKPNVKVILSSGYTEDAVSKSFPDSKPAGFLNKPYKLESMKAELERLLGTAG